MITKILGLLGLVFLSGFFSGGENALIALTEAQVRAMKDKGGKTAAIIVKLKKNFQRLLITLLVGNNVVNISTSVLTTVFVTEYFGSNMLGVATGILTLVILIFGEIFPKTLAERFSKQFSMIVAWPLYYLQILFFPIIWLLEQKITFIIKIIGAKREKVTEDEVKAMLNVSAEEGIIESAEKELIDNVMQFDETQVAQIMTPRAKIASLVGSTTIDAAIDFVVEAGHSRIPVYNKNIDNVIGILTVQGLLKAKKNRKNGTKIKDVELKSPIFVPETKFLNDLFKEFKWKHKHLAIVVNEHGSITGIVTMEDVLEEIVGDIVDESDHQDILIEQISDNSWRVNSEVNLEELEEALNTKFKDVDLHKSLGYLLLKKFQKIPRRGEDIKINNFHFFIEKMEKNKIQFVRVNEIM